jgi:type IX secretion system PorP/SprF family membrane protein
MKLTHMKNKLLNIFLFCILFLTNANAQDIHFSQVNETPLLMSPANTGFFNGYTRAIINYRNQWASMGNSFGAAFNTGVVSVDGGLFKSRHRKSFLGLGFIWAYDRAGSANITKNNVLLNISGIIKVGKKGVLSAGISGGVDNGSANYNNLRFASQFNGNYLEDNAALNGEKNFRQFTTTDINFGMAYEWSKVKTDQDHDDVTSLKFSYGLFHLNRAVQDFMPGSNYRMPMRHTIMVNAVHDFEDTKFTLVPVLVAHMQAKAYQMIVGSVVKYRMSTGTKTTGQKTQNAIGFGLYYRTKDAFIPQLTYDMDDLSFTASYDFNVSNYRTVSRYRGGFEIGIRYNKLASSLFDARREFK